MHGCVSAEIENFLFFNTAAHYCTLLQLHASNAACLNEPICCRAIKTTIIGVAVIAYQSLLFEQNLSQFLDLL